MRMHECVRLFEPETAGHTTTLSAGTVSRAASTHGIGHIVMDTAPYGITCSVCKLIHACISHIEGECRRRESGLTCVQCVRWPIEANAERRERNAFGVWRSRSDGDDVAHAHTSTRNCNYFWWTKLMQRVVLFSSLCSGEMSTWRRTNSMRAIRLCWHNAAKSQ